MASSSNQVEDQEADGTRVSSGKPPVELADLVSALRTLPGDHVVRLKLRDALRPILREVSAARKGVRDVSYWPQVQIEAFKGGDGNYYVITFNRRGRFCIWSRGPVRPPGLVAEYDAFEDVVNHENHDVKPPAWTRTVPLEASAKFAEMMADYYTKWSVRLKRDAKKEARTGLVRRARRPTRPTPPTPR